MSGSGASSPVGYSKEAAVSPEMADASGSVPTARDVTGAAWMANAAVSNTARLLFQIRPCIDTSPRS